MRVLTAVWTVVLGIFSGLKDFFGTVLGGVFGDVSWQPPAWLAPLLALVGQLFGRVRTFFAAHPRSLAAGVVALALLAVAGTAALHWQQKAALQQAATATVPQDVSFQVSAPSLSCYDCDGPVAGQPLTIRFPVSVSPLDLVEKEVTPASGLISLTPALPGAWRWTDDKTLVFTPSQDWPVATRFKVSFAKKGFVLPGVTLAETGFEFDTEPFKLWVQESQFVQDPVNPAVKTAQFILRASHPIDEKSLRDRLKLRYVYYTERSGSAPQETEQEAPAYTLVLDAKRLTATLRTATMALATYSGRMDVLVDVGVISTLGGNALREKQQAKVDIPGRGALRVNELTASIARDADDTPVQTLTLQLSQSATEAEVRDKVQAFVLPAQHPDAATQKAFEEQPGNEGKPYQWTETAAKAQLKTASALPLTYNVLEAEHSDLHSFRHQGEPGRYLLVRVQQGLKAFGGYELAASFESVVAIPQFPAELRLTNSGAFLSLSGSKKLTLFTRDLPGVRVQIGRLLPQQLQHVVTQASGRLNSFNWNNWSFDESNLTETFSKDIALPPLEHGQAHYEALDLAPYLAQGEATRRGIFFLRLNGYDPATGQLVSVEPQNSNESGEYEDYNYRPSTSDTRLIVITDLGLVAKRNQDGTRDVFVQSIATGEPVGGTTIEVIAKNGQSVLSKVTDTDGHVRLPELSGFQREREPVLFLARKNGDESFLPFEQRGGGLDLSRFDVGGVMQATDAGALSAYLFTDRGIYRPGESAHIGVVVKASEFGRPLPQTALTYEITDPRGTTVFKTSKTLPAGGLDDIEFFSSASAPSGAYTVSVWLPTGKGKHDRRQLGSLDFKLREFEPDRLKIRMNLNTVRASGWVKPEAITGAHIDLQNLFGTPAQDRRVTGSLKLTPWLPRFAGFEDYQFTDPQAAKEGVTVEINDAQTDTEGQADLAIDLKPYAATSYFLHLTAQGFEPGGGRGVTAEAGQVISTLPYLVGWKADDSLSWIAKDAKPVVNLVAIDDKAARTTANGLKLRRYSRTWVSVLVKSDSGYYHYESRQKDTLLSEAKLAIPVVGKPITLETSSPGSYLYVVADGNEQVFAKIPYEVSGYGNVTRSLDRNAELKIALSKKDYNPGEEIEVNLVAPYAGSGLITIERDKVLAYKWFKAATSASVQKIKLPDGLEGSAYVHVLFTRDPGSADVFSSPLSYGVAPFSVAIDARRIALALDAPSKIKPGETLTLKLTAAKPGKALVYAVDEGIHQVARYRTPDPLGFYFQKRALGVTTLQILDLILPEFRGLPGASAPGGDADSLLGANLNPFKRKTDAPIAWWSGVVEVGPTAKELTYVVPDRFNGALKLVAVSVAADSIGVAEGKTLVRGDFTLLPNAPLAVTPGDEFEVSTGVSNNIETAPKNAAVAVSILPTPNLEVIGAASQTLTIPALREGVARWRVRAKDGLGNAELAFTASYGGKTAKIRSTLSVRPPMPYSPNLAMVQVEPGKSFDIPVSKSQSFYPEFRRLEASVSSLPLVMAHGLTAYLGNYKNYCTEQLTSMAVPAMVLSARPEFGEVKKESGAGSISGLINELALRQRPEGDFAYWDRSGTSYEPVSIYALHFLLEANEHGFSVPPGMIESGNRFLTKVARQEINNEYDYYYGWNGRERHYGYSDRNVAYAIYLLTRQGQLMSAEADAAVKRLDAGNRSWRNDTTALWLAAAYSRMQQKDLADALVAGVLSYSATGVRSFGWQHGSWYFANDMSTDAEILYILAKHFPAQLAKYGPVLAKGLVNGINGNRYQTYASGTTLLALDAYAAIAAQEQGQYSVAEVTAAGAVRPLTLPTTATAKLILKPDTAKLRVSNAGRLPTYGMLAEMGFPKKTPEAAQAHGIEVLRRIVDDRDTEVSQVEVGKEVTMEIRLRAIDRDAVTGVALVDLLPGGFEIVPPSQPLPEEQAMQQAVPEEGENNGESEVVESEGDGEAVADEGKGQCNCDWVTLGKETKIDFAEPREDRAVLYANATRSVQIFRYRVKAVTEGRFTVPPTYGEAMYDRAVYGYSTGSAIEVVKPK